MIELDPCPCCGYQTITSEYDICPICAWEHDEAQERDPDSEIGANAVSLREAQRNFVAIGVCRPELKPIVREPRGSDKRSPTWTPLDS